MLGCFSGFLNGAIAALNNLENKNARPPPASMPATIPIIRLLDTVPNASPNAKAASRDYDHDFMHSGYGTFLRLFFI